MQVHIIEVDEEWHNQGYDLAGNNRPYWGAVRNKWTQAVAAADADGVDGAILQEELCDLVPRLQPRQQLSIRIPPVPLLIMILLLLFLYMFLFLMM